LTGKLKENTTISISVAFLEYKGSTIKPVHKLKANFTELSVHCGEFYRN
jgi:hypothetical protein